MRALRRIVVVGGFMQWIYSWYLIRGFRNFYSSIEGGIPFWLLLVMAATSTLLIGTCVVAAMRLPIWPALSMAAGPAFLLLVILGQLAIMRAASLSVGLGRAFRNSLESRGTFAVVVFIALIPTLLFLAGITELLRRPREKAGETGPASA